MWLHLGSLQIFDKNRCYILIVCIVTRIFHRRDKKENKNKEHFLIRLKKKCQKILYLKSIKILIKSVKKKVDFKVRKTLKKKVL